MLYAIIRNKKYFLNRKQVLIGDNMTDSELLKSFRRYLKVSNKRYTVEREELVRYLQHVDGFFDIGELFKKVSKKRVVNAKSTIYRNIFLLIDGGYIKEIRLNNGKIVYESTLSGDKHDHMVCVSCGKLVDFASSKADKLLMKECKNAGFEPIHCSAVVKGFCAECIKRVDG